MSKLSRSDKIALFVLALTLLALAGVALAGAISAYVDLLRETRELSSRVALQSDNHPVQEQFGIFSVTDTLAQWLMALFSLVATVISAWAVILLRKTLIETRRAVQVANDTVEVSRRIGEAQVRAYVNLDNINFTLAMNDSDKSLVCALAVSSLKNTGASPAFCTKIFAQIVVIEGGVSDPFPECEFSDYGPEMLACGSGSVVNVHPCRMEFSDLDLAFRGEARIFQLLYLSYRDVFQSDDAEHIFTCCTEIFAHMPPALYPKFDPASGLPAGAFGIRNYANHRIAMKKCDSTN